MSENPNQSQNLVNPESGQTAAAGAPASPEVNSQSANFVANSNIAPNTTSDVAASTPASFLPNMTSNVPPNIPPSVPGVPPPPAYAYGYLSSEQLAKLKSLSFWLKVYAVFIWLGSSSLFISGLLYLIILVGILFLAAGVVMVFLGIKIWRAAEAADRLRTENTANSYGEHSFEILTNLEWHFRFLGILQIGSIVLMIAIFIIILAFTLIVGISFGGLEKDKPARSGPDSSLEGGQPTERDSRSRSR